MDNKPLYDEGSIVAALARLGRGINPTVQTREQLKIKLPDLPNIQETENGPVNTNLNPVVNPLDEVNKAEEDKKRQEAAEILAIEKEKKKQRDEELERIATINANKKIVEKAFNTKDIDQLALNYYLQNDDVESVKKLTELQEAKNNLMTLSDKGKRAKKLEEEQKAQTKNRGSFWEAVDTFIWEPAKNSVLDWADSGNIEDAVNKYNKLGEEEFLNLEKVEIPGLDIEQTAEYVRIQNELDEAQKPALEAKFKEVSEFKKEIDDIQNQYIQMSVDSPKMTENSDEERYDPVLKKLVPIKEWYANEKKVREASMKLSKAEGLLKDKVEGNDGALSGLLADWDQNVPLVNLTTTIAEVKNAIRLNDIGNKEVDEINEVDKLFLRGIMAEQEVKSYNLYEDDFSYNTTSGLAHSLGFMTNFGIGKGLAAGGRKSATIASRHISKKLLDNQLKNVTLKGTPKVLKGATKRLKDFTKGSFDITAGSLLTPGSYMGVEERQAENLTTVMTSDDKEKYLLSDKHYMAYVKDLRVSLDELDVLEQKLDKNDPGYEEKLQFIEDEKENLVETYNRIYDPTTDKLKVEQEDLLKSYGYAAFETLKEGTIEAVAGPAFGKVFKSVGGSFDNLVSPLARKIGRTPVGISAYNTKSAFLRNQKIKYALGKGNTLLEKVAIGHTGISKLYNGIPSEMLEEVVAQVTPNVVDPEGYLEQLKELVNPDWYITVGTQVALMGGTMNTVAKGRQGLNYLTNAEYRAEVRRRGEEVKEAKKLFKSLQEVVDSKDEQEIVDMMMSVSSNQFDLREVKARIEQLRQEDTKESKEKANRIEKNNLLNLAKTAIETGTSARFEKTLRDVAFGGSVNNLDTKRNAQEALVFLNQAKKRTKSHFEKLNVGELVEAELSLMSVEKSAEDIKNKIEELRDRGDVEAAKSIAKEYGASEDIDISVEALVNEMLETEEGQTLELLKKLDSSSSHLEGHERSVTDTSIKNIKERAKEVAGLHYMLQSAESAMEEYRDFIKEASSDKHQEKLLDVYRKHKEEELAEETTNENVEEKKKEAKEKGFFNKRIFNVFNKKATNDALNIEENEASETTTTETQATETQVTEAKKADISIGKISNTEYEVKADGVYFKGKELFNPENLSPKELITEDIEARRREEQIKYGEVTGDNEGLSGERISKRLEIDAKYDAELKAIETQATETQNLSNETPDTSLPEEVEERVEETFEEAFFDEEDFAFPEEAENNTKVVTGTSNPPVNEYGDTPFSPIQMQPTNNGEVPAGNFSPIPLDSNSTGQQKKIAKFEKAWRDLFNVTDEISFKAVVSKLAFSKGKYPIVESNYLLMAQAWNNVARELGVETLTSKEIDTLYSEIFSLESEQAVKALDGFTSNDNIVQDNNSQESVEEAERIENQQTETKKEFKPVTSTIQSSNYSVVPGDRRYSGIGLKAGRMLGIEYEEENPGELVDANNNLRDEIKPYVDWRNWQEGQEIEMVFDWQKLLDPNSKIKIWINPDSKKVISKVMPVSEALEYLFKDQGYSYAEIAAEIEKIVNGEVELNGNTNILLRNEEFLKYIPVAAKNQYVDANGDIQNFIGVENGEFSVPDLLQFGIPETYWFNDSRVADKFLKVDKKSEENPIVDETEKKARIEENRAHNLNARKQIAANGSFKTKIQSKRTAAKNEYKREDGFKSIFSQFNNNQEEFEKFAGVGVLNAGGTDIYQSERGGHASRKTLEINGKPIKPEQVVNWNEAVAAVKEQNHSGKADGTMLFIYQSGQKINGDPVYTAKLVINNHEDLQEKAEKNYDILFELARRIENGNEELANAFLDQFGIDLGWSNLDKIMDYYMNLRMDYRFVHKHVSEGRSKAAIEYANKFKEAFDKDIRNVSYSDFVKLITNYTGSYRFKNNHAIKKELKRTDNAHIAFDFKQGMNLGNLANRNREIPNLDHYNSFEEFEQALMSGTVSRVNSRAVLYSNLHTLLKFSEIQNSDGESIYTPDSQPTMMFESEVDFSDKKKEDVERKIESVQSRIDYLENAKKEAGNSNPKETEQLTKEIKRLEEEVESLEEEVESLGGNLTSEGSPVSTDTQETETETVKDYTEEVDFLNEHEDEIKGTEQYQGSVREALDVILGLDPEADKEIKDVLYEMIDEAFEETKTHLSETEFSGTNQFIDKTTVVQVVTNKILEKARNKIKNVGIFEKDHNKSAFENNFKDSLSFQVKMALANIEDTREKDNIFGPYKKTLSVDEAIGVVHELMSQSTNNTLEEMQGVLNERVKMNPEGLAFMQKVLDRLTELEKIEPEIVNEILYSLYQPRTEMKFIMWTGGLNNFSLQTYDANAGSPQFKVKARWSNNFFQNKNLIEKYEGSYYKIDENEAQEISNKIKELVERYNKNNRDTFGFKEDLEPLLEKLGVELNDRLLEQINENSQEEHIQEIKDILFRDKGSFLTVIAQNLEKGLKLQKTKRLSKTSTKIDGEVQFNPLFNDNSQYKKLVDINLFYEFNIPSNMRIAGKNIYAYSFPNSIKNKTKKIKASVLATLEKNKESLTYDTTLSDEDLEGVLKEYKDVPILKNSFFLEMIKNHPKEFIEGRFDTAYVSLEAIKQLGSKSKDNRGLTELSDIDLTAVELGFFTHYEGEVSNTDFSEKYKGIGLRKGVTMFPTLSDSSQMPILNTILLNLNKENIDSETGVLSSSLYRLITDKLLQGELLRIADYMLKANGQSDVDFYDEGATWIHSFPMLNSLLVEDKTGQFNSLPLIEVFRRKLREGTDISPETLVRTFLQSYKDDIKKKIEESFTIEAQEYHTNMTEAGFVDEYGNLNLTDNGPLNYYNDKTSMMVAYDYVINYKLQQYEIHNNFAGDTSNYFKSKTAKDLEYGMPRISFDDVLAYYYSDNIQTIRDLVGDTKLEDLSSEKRQELFTQFPKFKYLDLDITEDKEGIHKEMYEQLAEVYEYKMVQMYEEVQNNLSKRLKELLSPGAQFPNSANLPTYRQIMVSDIENISESIEEIFAIHYPEKSKDSSMLDDIREYVKGMQEETISKDRKKELEGIFKEEIPKVVPFLETKTTDAQEYVTWQENLLQLRRQGRIANYEYETIKAKLEAQEKDLASKEGKIKEENLLTEKERKIALMQPSKPLYSGEEISDVNGHKAMNYIYIKSSSFPLLPEMTQAFPKMNKLREIMNLVGEIHKEETGGEVEVRLSYQSANKVGGMKNAISLKDLYNGDLESPEFVGNVLKSSRILKRENFFIQQDKPFKGDKNAEMGKEDKTVRATQFEKIILGDGVNKMGHIFPAKEFDKDLLDSFGIKPEEGMISGKDLSDIYKSIYEREQKLFKEKMFRKLGITSYKDIHDGKPSAMEKFAELVNARLDNMQDKEAISLLYQDVDGNVYTKQELIADKTIKPVKAFFKLPLYLAPNSNKFESVLNSFVNKNSINLKMPGSSSPVGSQAGFDFKNIENFDIEELLERGLITTPNFDKNGLKPNQILLPNRFKYFKKGEGDSPGRYEYVDFKEKDAEGNYLFLDENGQLDFNKIPEELVSMFSFRIPTSSHQSGVLVEVVGFLPHSMGDLAIVSQDATITLGEDYDIDVRYMYSYNMIMKDGKLKKLEYSDLASRPEKTHTELWEELKAEKQRIFEEYYMQNAQGGNVIKNSSYEHNRKIFEEIVELDYMLKYYDDYVNVVGEEEAESKREIKRKIKDLRKSIIAKEVVRGESVNRRKEFEALREEAQRAFEDENSTLKAAWDEYNTARSFRANESKVLENGLISMYKAVYQTDNAEMKALINNVLSTDFAEETVSEMEKVSGKSKRHFDIFSPNNQRNILKLGADGQKGIGLHSNGVTINSIIQQLETPEGQEGPLKAYVKQFRDESGVITNIPYNINLGNLVFDGVLGRLNRTGKRISESLMESQNSATDNQKLQIMGRRNENETTMAVFSVMQMNGLEVEGITVGGKNLSYASMFIKQPIIEEFTKIVKASKSSINGQFTSDSSVLQGLIAKLKEDLPDKYITEEGDVDYNKINKEVGENLTSAKLFDMLGEKDPKKNIAEQFHILNTFASLKKVADDVSTLQKVVNIEANGLGKSYFDTIEKVDNLLSLPYDINIEASQRVGWGVDIETGDSLFTKMFGDMKIASDGEIERLEEQGYVFLKSTTNEATGEVSNILIKPDTHYAHKIVNSLSQGYNMWKTVFPYESKYLKEQIDGVIAGSIYQNGSASATELKYSVMSAMKDYFYTLNSTFLGNLIDTHRSLFFETETNESLASYLNRISRDNTYSYLFNKPFFANLTPEVEGKDYPSLIKYDNQDRSPEENLRINNTLLEMYKSDRKLPPLNGKEMTERDLVLELAKYSLLANQEGGAIGFRNYIPQIIFDENGVTEKMRSLDKTIGIDSEIQNVELNGVLRSVNSLLESRTVLDKLGIGTYRGLSKLSKEDYSRVINFLNIANEKFKSFGVNYDLYTLSNNGDTIVLNMRDPENYLGSSFIKQYMQHNIDIVPNAYVKDSEITHRNSKGEPVEIALKSGGITNENAENKRFIKVENKDGSFSLFERYYVNNHKYMENGEKNSTVKYYRRIPTLGTFGFNEYRPASNISKSLVEANNFEPSVPTMKPFNTERAIKNLETGEVNLSTLLSQMIKDPNSRYKEIVGIFKYFTPNADEVGVRLVNNLQGVAQYDKVNNEVLINKRYMDRFKTNDDFQKVIVEEFLHYVTTNAIGKYGKFEQMHDTSFKVKFVPHESDKTVPYQIANLVDIYNSAIDHYSKVYSQEKMFELSQQFVTAKKDNKSVVTNTNEDLIGYILHDPTEFFAHIFIKDTQFYHEMAKTPYKNSKETIVTKFFSNLLSLVKRIFPSARKDSISHQTLQNLVEFLHRNDTEGDLVRSRLSEEKPLSVSQEVKKGLNFFSKYLQEKEQQGDIADKAEKAFIEEEQRKFDEAKRRRKEVAKEKREVEDDLFPVGQTVETIGGEQDYFPIGFEEGETSTGDLMPTGDVIETVGDEQESSSVKDVGQYVTFNGETYIVVKENDNGTIQIYNPLKEGAQAKKSVAERNLTPLKDKAKIVTYEKIDKDGNSKSSDYIVTSKNTIISLITNKVMNWGKENGDRKAILELAEKQDSEVGKENITFENSFTNERQKEIITNFANKHKMSEKDALDYIQEGIMKEGQKAIDKLKECY